MPGVPTMIRQVSKPPYRRVRFGGGVKGTRRVTQNPAWSESSPIGQFGVGSSGKWRRSKTYPEDVMALAADHFRITFRDDPEIASALHRGTISVNRAVRRKLEKS